MLPGLKRLYGQKEAPAAYRHEVQAMVRVLQDRYGLRRREMTDAASGTGAAPSGEPATPPQQAGFDW
jgi:hypothetical protein